MTESPTTLPLSVKIIGLTTAVLLGLSSCAPLVVGGAATGGVTAIQERSVGRAVDDATIEAAINHYYIQEGKEGTFSSIDVESNEGRVLLTGNVMHPETAVDAVRLAWKPEGVREVINEIQVTDKSGFANYAQDSWITTQIKSQLLFAKGIKSVNYNVETVNGKVYLLGIAQNNEELQKVTSTARRVANVREVVSHVRMKDDERRPY